MELTLSSSLILLALLIDAYDWRYCNNVKWKAARVGSDLFILAIKQLLSRLHADCRQVRVRVCSCNAAADCRLYLAESSIKRYICAVVSESFGGKKIDELGGRYISSLYIYIYNSKVKGMCKVAVAVVGR